jgi:glycosyltransferase involved in cell wall biosynthesis
MAVRFAPLGVRGAVLYSPGFVAPFGWERRTVVTVHDLHYLDPAITKSSRVWYYRNVEIRRLRQCRLVLTVSEYSANEIRDVLGARGPDVVVVGNGVDPLFIETRTSSIPAVPRLVFVGGDKPNKNLAAAMRAIATAARRSPVELVVVGDVAPDLQASAPPEVSFVGTLDDAALAALYASSTALLMPSLAEGFGLPALESLVAGKPVVFGNRGALPDVVGEWGWSVDPGEDDSIAAGIESAVTSPIVVPVDRRLALAAESRWDAVAQRVVAAVEEVL